MRPSLASIDAKPPAPAGQGSSARGSRVGSIYQSVLDAVVEHRLPPGAKLTEDQLGAIFGASRTTVRSALQALAHDRIVTLARHRRGARRGSRREGGYRSCADRPPRPVLSGVGRPAHGRQDVAALFDNAKVKRVAGD